MDLDCIRHGLTTSNLQGRFSGHGSDGLTKEQTETLSTVRFSAKDYDRVYCSPLVRCLETARSLNIGTVVQDRRLMERHFGIFEGLTVAECRDRFAEEFAAFRGLDAHYVIPGGESRAQHLERTLAWLEEASQHERVLAVTHGGTIDFLYRLGRGLPPHGGDTVYAGNNARVSRFSIDWPAISVTEFNIPLAT